MVVLLFASIGCDAGVPTYPVTGTVTNDNGDPVEGAAVTFIADSGGGALAVGVTDASGIYNLKTRSKEGAQAGVYKVTIAKYDPASDPEEEGDEGELEDVMDITDEYPDDFDESKANEKADEASSNQLPQFYADANTSGLTATVSAEGENKIDFTIQR